VLLADDHANQTLFRVCKEQQGHTLVEKITAAAKYEVVFELLGGSPADLLLPDNFLITEGPSEAIFLKEIIQRFYPGSHGIHILPATGDDERQRQVYTAMNDLLVTLAGRKIYRDRLIMLFDKPTGLDKQQRFDRFKSANIHLERNGQLMVLPHETLEDCYPADLRAASRFTSDKKKLAREMGHTIPRERFEAEMPVLHQTLVACMAKAYGD
jgi:putative ATP-dependent endonuclease of the OLD family